ncbi:DUF2147 domain-containing protein [Acinetobacter wuhouensis]|uniref:DUF2147 domain-containing protein n=1 Tax=Acinetobacter wuhouensis TaxID=1879050 RepID=A0A385C1W6_9GAMM|nr:DUF2147 domain-containing protein [Acinetobacter wuhouensis]AXQ21033.1 DUF2147 domain-containing protein [Acinetobacter wuhouensis]RZG49087.1 DUF2147 domain-containing protein [Acinetobacter wuhouensis]
MKKILLCCLSLITSLSHAYDLTGKWKTVDDKTGYSRADVEIVKNPDGTYSGKIYTIRPLPGKPLEPKCLQCKGNLKNAPYVGLQIISGFKQDPNSPNEFIDGQVLDPLSGKVYKGKAKVNAKNNRLNMRGYIGVSMLGRSVTWLRIE